MTEHNNYNKTIFYKIICRDEGINDKYVGHTTNFRERSRNHKSACNNPTDEHYNYKLYKFIRENGGFDNFKIVIIEERNYNSKKEATVHEGYLINILEASLNIVMPGRTKQEWKKQYAQENRERQKQRISKAFECPCCKCLITWGSRSKHYKTTKHQKAMTIAGL